VKYGPGRGPARHGPKLILGRAGPKLNVPGLFGLGPGRVRRPECKPICRIAKVQRDVQRYMLIRLLRVTKTIRAFGHISSCWVELHLIRSALLSTWLGMFSLVVAESARGRLEIASCTQHGFARDLGPAKAPTPARTVCAAAER
jgi:hypothetical protein